MNELPNDVIKKARSQQRRWALSASVVVAIFYSLTMFPWLGCEWRRLSPLIKSNVHVDGEVSASYRSDHCTCKYKFSASGREFEGSGRSCCDIPIGGKINVYYLESDPKQSTNMEPISQFWGDFWSSIFGLFLMLLIAGLVVYFRTRSKAIAKVNALVNQ